MQEIKKRRIVIASVLKPVDDSRMFEKLGQTLAKEHCVWIIGFAGKHYPVTDNLIQVPLAPFKRLSIGRLAAPWKIFSQLLKLNPDTLIITTHELIIPALVLKAMRKVEVMYDIQENYFRNILYTPAFPKVVRPLVAAYVRLKEKLATPFIRHFLLAENGYEEEMRFIPPRKTVLQNKYYGDELSARNGMPGRNRLIFTGTLSETTGVFRAIDVADSLHKIDPSIVLTIAGYCARPAEYQRLVDAIEKKPFIQLIGGNKLVPHDEIIKLIQQSDFGIVAYTVSPATENSIPTKLFEYAALKLPMLVVKHKPWVDFVNRNQAGLIIQDEIGPERLLSIMKNSVFYFNLADDFSWKSEEPKLLAIFNKSKISR